jgi:amino acid transporter
MMSRFRRILLGRRLASEELSDTKIGNPIALSVFCSDALSSVAYASQEIMASLSASLTQYGPVLAAGALAHPIFRLSAPVAIAIVVLLAILGTSYRQTILTYPKGGGAYIVAKENLGEIASLVAGVSLLVEFFLTVAVSVSAGVANMASAFKIFHGHEVSLTVGAILVIALANLRGIKESGKFFAIPTYGFLFFMALMLGAGAIKALFGHAPPSPEMVATSTQTMADVSKFAMLLIFLKAFSAGCTALTGLESISNGTSAFEEPCHVNASKVMLWLMVLLGTLFLGITLLAGHFNVAYSHTDSAAISETLLSLLAKAIYGDVSAGLPKLLYFATMTFTFLILVVAANSVFAAFPRLSAVMGRHRYLPKQMGNMGDRLVFSNGIFILALGSCFLVWLLKANTDLLLPLYAVGAFTSFTISQAGMVVHWWKVRDSEERWRMKAAINAIGAATTAVVWINIVANKFKMEQGIGGVWIILLLLPILVYFLLRIHKHYVREASMIAISRTDAIVPHKNRVILLVSKIHHGTLEAIRYAKAVASDGRVQALNVDFTDENGQPSPRRPVLEANWKKYGEGIPIRFIENRFRQIVEPIIEEIRQMQATEPESIFTVVLPEFVAYSFFGNLLHNQTALRLKAMLLTMPNVVVTSVPYKTEARH